MTARQAVGTEYFGTRALANVLTVIVSPPSDMASRRCCTIADPEPCCDG